MEFPILRFRQGTVEYIYLHLQIHRLEVFTGNGQCSFIFTGTGVRRYPYIHPNRLGGTRLNVVEFYNIQHIGNDGRVPFRFIFTMSATAFTIFIQFVGHYITNEIGGDGRCRNNGWTVFQVGNRNRCIRQVIGSPQNRLSVDTFTLPGFCLPTGVFCNGRDTQFRVTNICASPA